MDVINSFEQQINRSDYKILIVDDVVSNVLLLKILLTNEKFQVCTANCGNMCVEQAKAEKPDLILLDVMMPDISGFDSAHLKTGSTSTFPSKHPLLIPSTPAPLPRRLKTRKSNVSKAHKHVFCIPPLMFISQANGVKSHGTVEFCMKLSPMYLEQSQITLEFVSASSFLWLAQLRSISTKNHSRKTT